MLKSSFAFVLCLFATTQLHADAKSDAIALLQQVNAKVQAAANVKSPSSNFSAVTNELSGMSQFAASVQQALSKLNIDQNSDFVKLSASIQLEATNAQGKATAFDLSGLVSLCGALSGDLDKWNSLVPAMIEMVRNSPEAQQAFQALVPTPTPLAGLGAGQGSNAPTPIPGITIVMPTAVPTLPPIVGTAATPTPIAPAAGGVIPGGWVAPTPTAVVTPVPGQPTVQVTPQMQVRAPVALVAGHNGQRVWVANVRSNSVSVMDAHSQRFVSEIAVGSQPQALGVDDGDGTVVVANFASNNVSLLDGYGDTVLKTIGVASGPMQILVTHAGKAYVLCQDGKSVAVIDLKLKLLIKSVKLSSRPGHMDQPNSGQTIYISLPDEDSVAVFDTGFDDVMATVKD